ncbi:MAG: glycosyltransferase family 39 protein [Caldilineaceae bacterium]|nr:glycosyltransferase family 39 protein [Caldilineaceae bacterium]
MANRPFLRNTQHVVHNAAISVLLTVFILLAGTFSITTPAFETPDEIWHFAFIQHLVTARSLPVSEPNTQAMWRQQGVQAPGYYLAAALLTAGIDQSDFPEIYARANPHAAIGQPGAAINRNYLIHHVEENFPWHGSILALHIARFFSVFLGAVTVYTAYRILRILLGEGKALLGAAFIAAIPQFLFISAAASNDNAVNAGAGLVIWWLVDTTKRQKAKIEGKSGTASSLFDRITAQSPNHPVILSPSHFVILGLLLGLALLAKLSSLALVGLSGLVILWLAWRARSWRLVWNAALWAGLPSLLIAGWWYWRNWRLYGDPLAWNVWEANILLRVIPADWRVIVGELGSLERSFWGLFGWLNLPYPEWVYAGFRGVEILLAAGLLVSLLRAAYSVLRRASAKPFDRLRPTHSQLAIRNSQFAVIPLGWLALLLFSWLNFMRVAPAAQGRYFFPAAAALGLLFVWGTNGYGKRIGPRLGWGIVGGLFILSAATPFWLIGPAYRAPRMPPAQASETLAVFGVDAAQIELVAASATPENLRPGDTATIRLAWLSRAPVTTDYSIFLHLVDGAGLTIAQLDTIPGRGLRPTSGWDVGGVLWEEYAVSIPATAYTPNRAHWEVGLYDHRTEQRLPLLHPAGESYRFGSTSLEGPTGVLPNPLDVRFADNISLVGYALDRRVLRPGQEMTATLYWQARGPVAEEYTIFAHILDDDLQMHGGVDVGPTPATTAWQPGTAVESVHTFRLSPDAPPGLYRFEIGLYTQPDFRRLGLLDTSGAEGADRFLLGPLRVQP